MDTETSAIRQAFASQYNKDILLSPFQAQTIGSAILSRQPGCRLLVFGLGNDTGLWLEINKRGTTHFLETSSDWVRNVQKRHTGISFSIMPTFGLTVSNSKSLGRDDFEPYPVIDELRGSEWDVILVDGPPGHIQTDPGRAIAIYWASKLATTGTHVFIDDYERPIESRFANMFLRDARSNSSTIIPASAKRPERLLYWSIGSPLPS